MRVNQIKVVVARPQIDSKILERRKVVLQIEACLSAFHSAAEAECAAGVEVKNLSVSPAINKKAFQFAQPRQTDPGFKNVPMPQVHNVTLSADGERSA